MKHLLSLFMLWFHLLATVGISLQVHACGSFRTYSWMGIHVGASCKCDHRATGHSDKCCHDKKVEIKSGKSDVQKARVCVLSLQVCDMEAPVWSPCGYIIPKPASVLHLLIPEGHPPDSSPPLYQLYGVYRI